MAYSQDQKLLAKLKRCVTLDDAQNLISLYLGTDDEITAAKAMLLCHHNSKSKLSFAQRLASVSPKKANSIDINHSRFNRLVNAKTPDEFIGHFKTCLKVIDFDCSARSIETVIEQFFNDDPFRKDKQNLWNVKLGCEFYQYQI